MQFKSQLQTEYHYTDLEMRQINYVLISFGSEISKLILITLFFFRISKLEELAVSVIALLSVRNFTGGIHLKHYISCLLLSFGIFFTGICVLPEIICLDTLTMLIILNICIILIYRIGPVLSSYRPVLSEERKKSSSLKAATSVLIYTFAVFVFQKNSCLYAGFWIIVLQTLQLGLAKYISTRKEKRI